MRPILLVLGLIAAIALGYVLVSEDSPPVPGERAEAEPRTLTIGVTQYPSTFHPSFDPTVVKSVLLGLAQRPIISHDPDWELTCHLCTELPSRENGLFAEEVGPDGEPRSIVTFTLHPEARWGDGTPLTAEDVVFSWETGRAPGSGYPLQSLLAQRLVDIRVENEKTVTMVYDRRYCSLADLVSFQILPRHIEAPVVAAGPLESYQQRTAYDTDPFNPGLYLGPYRISEAQADGFVVLERNPFWWGAEPVFDRIVLRTIANTAALDANLLSGDIDVLSGGAGASIAETLQFVDRHGDRFEAVIKPSLFFEHLDTNFDNPLLADVRVRRALLLAVDREAISEQLFRGLQPVADGSVNPLDSVYWDGVPRMPYDPEAAIALLEDAGFTILDEDGIRRNEAGEALRFDIKTTAGDKTRERVQQILQQHWRAIGVDVRIANKPARVLFGDTTRTRDYDGLLMYAWLSAPGIVPRTTLHSSMIPTEENNWAGQNVPGYRSAEMDRILDALEQTCEPEARQQLWNDLQALYAEDLPTLPLFFRSAVALIPKWLTGYQLTGHLAPSTLWVEEWGVADGYVD